MFPCSSRFSLASASTSECRLNDPCTHVDRFAVTSKQSTYAYQTDASDACSRKCNRKPHMQRVRTKVAPIVDVDFVKRRALECHLEL